MKTLMTSATSSATSLAILFAMMPAAHAVENGAPIVPFGVYDFGAALLPPATESPAVGVRATSYQAHQLRDGAGQRSPVDLGLRVNSYGVALLKMTDTTLFGARYGYAAVLPVLSQEIHLGIPTPAGRLHLAGDATGRGDLQVTPLILQWQSRGLFQAVALQLQVPTGQYDPARAINPGTHHWSITPMYAVTWISATGVELSSQFQLNFNTRNHTTHYRSGAEWQHEFALGQHLGAWTVGLGGYHYRQVSNDKAAGLADGNRARVTALGPALAFFAPGSGLPSVWLHAYREFDAQNRSQGRQVALRAAWVF